MSCRYKYCLLNVCIALLVNRFKKSVVIAAAFCFLGRGGGFLLLLFLFLLVFSMPGKLFCAPHSRRLVPAATASSVQAYFSEVLMEHRDVWDGSDEIENFFFPGAPTSYSAALSRRRSEQLKEVKDFTSGLAIKIYHV